jgi:hypothetical protein
MIQVMFVCVLVHHLIYHIAKAVLSVVQQVTD